MSLLIEITESPVSRKGKSSSGRDYEIITHRAYIHKESEKYPSETVIPIESVNDAHELGFYELNLEGSITTSDFNQMAITRFPVLVKSQPPKRV
jgi:hypothetical protein